MKARILPKSRSEEKKWEQFLKKSSTIPQTPAWGHFQAKSPNRGKYWIIVLEKNNQIIGGSMIIRHGLPKGYCWLYSARGPIMDYQKDAEKKLKLITEALKPIAKQEKAVFYRIDPPFPKKNAKKFPHFHQNHLGFQPEHTLILDLTKSEKEILAQMKQKGRYNIRLAAKKGVEIHESKDVTAFHKILRETTRRDKFHGHKKIFYQNMLDTLHPLAKLYYAQYKNEIIAGIIVTFYSDEAIYYYGASSDSHREVMAPYLLQWHAIKEAKSQGCRIYDFLGIAPENTKKHAWQGVTQFKKKFGGTPIDFAAPQDLPFKKLHYLFYRIYKLLR